MNKINHRGSTEKIDWPLYIIEFEGLWKKIQNYPFILDLDGWKISI